MTCWLCGFKTTELATNARPSTCKNGSCQICKAVDEVDKEIDQAAANLRRLISTRLHLRSEQNRAHDLVHRLPVELKNYIFELLLPPRNEWGVIPQSEETVMPSYLASICKGWRDIAWSNPFLWSAMHIPIGRRTTPDSSKHMRDWILRSDTLPLTVHIQVVDHTGRDFERSRNVMVSILDAISQCSSRLQSLSLDAPYSILYAYPSSNFQWDRLTRLRTIPSFPEHNSNQPLSLFNPTASPEMVDFHYLSLRSVQISWNRLSCAILRSVDLKDLTRLFQQASQMTHCQIFDLKGGYSPGNFSVPPITHHRLKILALWSTDPQAEVTLLRSLTLPCLQELSTNDFTLLMHLPALVCRSSCPLTSLTLSHYLYSNIWAPPDGFLPLPGVTSFVVETDDSGHLIMKLLLEDYLPDLRHLTFRLEAFLYLWNTGVVPLYLDRKRPLSDGFNKGRLETFLVIVKDADELDRIWNSDGGEELKALNARLREDGFEFL